MWAPLWGSSSGSGRRTWRRRIADYLADDQTDVSDNESFITAHSDEYVASTSAAVGVGAGGMLPAFLADQSDLVEVMLELDEESMVVRSVTPTVALYGPTTSLPRLGGGAHARRPAEPEPVLVDVRRRGSAGSSRGCGRLRRRCAGPLPRPWLRRPRTSRWCGRRRWRPASGGASRRAS